MPQFAQTPTAQAPAVPPPAPFVVSAAQVPKTAEEVRALRIKLETMQDQLQTAVERRMSTVNQMEDAPGRAQAGLERRLAELDGRIVGLEREITTTTAMLQAAPTAAVVGATPPGPDPAAIAARLANDAIPIVAIISTFVFAPIAFSIARFFWRRSSVTQKVAAPDHATQQKIEQLQQSVDTIAIEIERISEGQRFVTRLLAERSSAERVESR